jgi:outer membrane murein-binding lipoprotein Lpp
MSLHHILAWISHNFTTDHVSLLVSALAFVVALWAGYQARRSALATEKQALVASDQLKESVKSSNSAQKAAKETKAVTWHDITDRLMERNAKVAIGIEKVNWPPILLEEIPEGNAYPRIAEPGQPKTVNARSLRENTVRSITGFAELS